MEKTTVNEIVKSQFNKQAQNFSNWSVTQNIEYLQGYFDFCRINPKDTLLDVACGTGEFLIFSSPKVKQLLGVDISDGMIELAKIQAAKNNIKNAKFVCHDVKNIPCGSNSFSLVVCRSAFHHIHNYNKVLSEMIRCCKDNGRISIQDIVAYENNHVNDYFEQIERAIDISHNVALSKDFITNLYEKNNLSIVNTFDIEVELNFEDYICHAKQTKDNQMNIEDLLQFGINDDEISKYFMLKNNELFFKRNVFLILGEKK